MRLGADAVATLVAPVDLSSGLTGTVTVGVLATLSPSGRPRQSLVYFVRDGERRLIEAASTDGDWRLALFRSPKTMLQPLDATGNPLTAGPVELDARHGEPRVRRHGGGFGHGRRGR